MTTDADVLAAAVRQLQKPELLEFARRGEAERRAVQDELERRRRRRLEKAATRGSEQA
jgi:hypothetical protein